MSDSSERTWFHFQEPFIMPSRIVVLTNIDNSVSHMKEKSMHWDLSQRLTFTDRSKIAFTNAIVVSIRLTKGN